MSVDSDAAKAGDSGWRETVKIVIHALILAVIVRIFFYQPFNIPSGSMKETLLVGDYLFVSKLSYGYSRYSFPFGLEPVHGPHLRRRAQAWRRGRIQAAARQLYGLHQAHHRPARRRDLRAQRRRLYQRQGSATDARWRLCRPRRGRPRRSPRYKETLPNGVILLRAGHRAGRTFRQRQVPTSFRPAIIS